jgi:chromosome segregation ATPase
LDVIDNLDWLANNNVDLISELQEKITSLEEAAKEVSWTRLSQRDEISRMDESIDREKIHHFMLSKKVGRLQAQINNLQASRPGMESKMEYAPSKELTSCAACVGETAGVDDYSSNDNLSLFSISYDNGNY